MPGSTSAMPLSSRLAGGSSRSATNRRAERHVVDGEPAGRASPKKALVISLDEVLAGRYDEGMHQKISIVSESLASLS